MGLFSSKKTEQQKRPNAAAYIVEQINRMAASNNFMFIFGMLCFAYDFELITLEERQALDSKAREKANELLQKEKAEKEAARIAKAQKIAEYEAQRKEKAKAARAKMQEGK